MKTTAVLTLLALASLATISGCEDKKAAPTPAPKSTAATPAALPADLFLAAAPADAKTVEEVKKASPKPGDVITVSGRIGGEVKPFVDGRAAFALMGPGLPACSDTKGDSCETPWDYCCEKKEDIAAHRAMVQVVDASGSPLRADLKGQHGLKELSEVIIVGKVASADGPALVINATNIYAK